MPVYDYKCPEHGLFHELVAMDANGDTQPCPDCGDLASRVLLVSPGLLDMPPERRQAMDRNERAANEPRHGNHTSEQDGGCRHRPRDKPRVFYTADGHKTFPSARPWMISH
ncbi:MAG: formamidase [Halomonas sp.]|nr:formamidase [Halomonas sp.]